MIGMIAVLLFALWLLGVFHVYIIGWYYHAFLVASILLIFMRAVRTRNKAEIEEIMDSNEIPQAEAEKVNEIVNKNKLNEQEALELLNIRKHHIENHHDLIQTSAGQIKKIMDKNRLSQQEAVELLSVRLKLHH